MKNLSIRILFLCVFISVASVIANAQILFDPPKEWANSVPQSVIDASPSPNLTGKPMDVSALQCKKICTQTVWFDDNWERKLLIGVKPSADRRDTDENYKDQYPDWSEQAAFSGKDDSSILARVLSYIRTHRWQKALDYSNRVISKWYGSPNAYFYRGMIFFALGQKERAIKDLDASIFWSSQLKSGKDSDAYLHARLQRGIIYALMGDAAKANEDYQKTGGLKWENMSGGETMLAGQKTLIALINQSGKADDGAKLAFADKILDGGLPACDADPKVLEFSAEKNHRKYETLLFLTKSAFQCKNVPKAYEYAKQFIEYTRAEQKADNTLLNRQKVKIAYAVRRDIYEYEGKFVQTVYDALEAYKIVSNRFDGDIILNDEEYAGAETLLNQLSKVKNENPFSLEEMSMFLGLRSSFKATQKKKADENDAKLAQLASDKVGSFRLCNQFGQPLAVAVSYPDKDVAGRFSDGWRWLKNGECTPYITVKIADVSYFGKPKYAAYANEIKPATISGMNESTCLPIMSVKSGHHSIPFACSGDFDSFPVESINVEANKILTLNINLQR